MTSKERINTSMTLGQPDRVPVWCLLSLEHIIKQGTADGRLPDRVDAFIEAECNLTRRYGFDGHIIYFPNLRKNSDVGSLLNKMIYDVPHGTEENIFETADPESWAPENAHYEQDDFYACAITREILGRDMHIGAWIPDGFSKAIQWFPAIEEASLAMITDPARFASLVAYFDRWSANQARAFVETGKIESIQISSPYAGSSFISRAMYEQFVLPSVAHLAAAVRESGAFSYIHTCGFIGDRLDLLVKSGSDGIECMDPPPLGDVSLAGAKQRIGNRLFLKGNIDSVNTLLLGSEEQIEKTIRETIAAGKPGGGFILSTACSVAPDVPPERVLKLSEINARYGCY